MVGCGNILFDAQETTQLPGKLQCKSTVPVTDDLSRESIVLEHPLDKEFYYPLCSNFLCAWYEEGCLGTVMVSDGEDEVVLLGLREFGDEVKSDNLKWVCPGFWKYWC